MENIRVTATEAASTPERPATFDVRAAIEVATRTAGPVMSWGVTMLLYALADASAMSLVTPPREHRR